MHLLRRWHRREEKKLDGRGERFSLWKTQYGLGINLVEGQLRRNLEELKIKRRGEEKIKRVFDWITRQIFFDSNFARWKKNPLGNEKSVKIRQEKKIYEYLWGKILDFFSFSSLTKCFFFLCSSQTKENFFLRCFFNLFDMVGRLKPFNLHTASDDWISVFLSNTKL